MGFLRYLYGSLAADGDIKADSVSYPFFADPKELYCGFDDVQAAGVSRLLQKILDGTYRRVRNPCLCGNAKTDEDTLVSRCDMHGIPLDVLLCRKCGLLRSAEVFDAVSNENYYRYEYRDIHNGGKNSADAYFTAQLERGESFLGIATDNRIIDEVETVLEIGCGCGGILYPFHLAGKKVLGFDYDEDYVSFGREKGMALYSLGKDPDESRGMCDLLILSHVLEHFLDPAGELVKSIERIKPGKYMIVEVPGVFAQAPAKVLYGYPVRYFQIAHVTQFFYKDFLVHFFRSSGLEIIHGDENATFLLRKPESWRPPASGFSLIEELSHYRNLVDRHLRERYSDYRYRPDSYKLKIFCIRFFDKIGLKNAVKALLIRFGML